MSLTLFQQAVVRVVRSVPAGQVVSYGQVAAYIGSPRAARQVGWALASLGGLADFPWWRVVNNAGKITIRGNFQADGALQRELLLQEGVDVTDHFTLDIARYRYRADEPTLASFELDPGYRAEVLRKYDLE